MIRLTGLRLWIGIGALSAAAIVGGASMLPHEQIGATVPTAHRAAPVAAAVADPRLISSAPVQPVTAPPAPVSAAPSAAPAVTSQSAPFVSTTVPVAAVPAAQEVPTVADRCSAMTGGGHGRPVPPMCAPLAPQP
jgi:hypothetical protein